MGVGSGPYGTVTLQPGYLGEVIWTSKPCFSIQKACANLRTSGENYSTSDSYRVAPSTVHQQMAFCMRCQGAESAASGSTLQQKAECTEDPERTHHGGSQQHTKKKDEHRSLGRGQQHWAPEWSRHGWLPKQSSRRRRIAPYSCEKLRAQFCSKPCILINILQRSTW